jgi:hypothetical protein
VLSEGRARSILLSVIGAAEEGFTFARWRRAVEGKASVVTPAVRQLTGRDPIPFAQFARDYADKLR